MLKLLQNWNNSVETTFYTPIYSAVTLNNSCNKQKAIHMTSNNIPYYLVLIQQSKLIDLTVHIKIIFQKKKKLSTYKFVPIERAELTIPGPSVHGPPTKAIMRAPVPGKHAPSRPAATLRATPVHRDALLPDCTGH